MRNKRNNICLLKRQADKKQIKRACLTNPITKINENLMKLLNFSYLRVDGQLCHLLVSHLRNV